MSNGPERREDDPWEQLLKKAGITMEELMAYADGVLGPDRRADVRVALEKHPELMQLLETFLFTRGAFVRPYDELLAKPLPSRLIKAAQGRRWPSLRELVRGLYAPNPVFRAAVLAAAVATVVLAAWLLRSPLPDNVVILDESGVVPSQAVQRVLDGTPGGQLTRVAGHLSIRPKLTFYSQQKSWCRQYDLVWDQNMQASALACRGEDGVWRVQVATGGAAPAADRQLAGGSGVPEHEEILRAVRRQIIDGTSLRLPEEQELIGNGWKRRSP